MTEIVLALVVAAVILFAISTLFRARGAALPTICIGPPAEVLALNAIEERVFRYLADGRESLVCDFLALRILGIPPETPRTRVTDEDKRRLEGLSADIEEAAERLVTRGLLAPHVERFCFTDGVGSIPCRTPGIYVLTDAGRRAARRLAAGAQAKKGDAHERNPG